mmetsp:Transcript_42297/g.62183  ORF Transcript_42297/g.62183 Transcript_42297/m.62183 type:complete len:476 (+) Transcript_42297:158-1585(+)
MDSNEKVLREAARVYDCGNADGIGRELDLVGHSALLEQLQVHFQELPQDLCERVRAIRAPNDCISVLLLGNHSAGKSSFINWYVGEKVQTTSVAMETAGVTLVRRGKKRTQWRGKMTLGNFPALERLGRLPGLCDHIVTEFSTSEKNAFRSLELIDTPGLVDGNVRYPFDVDAAMDELAKEASLVIVFLDPIGKALVGRCMKAVERLSTMHHSKMHYVLSKMDTVADAHDRQTVVSQVAQELQSRVKGTHALKILQIYLPEKAGEGVGLKSKQEKTRTQAPNQLLDVVDLLRRTVDSRAQEVVVRALEDCKSLRDLGEKLLVYNQTRNSHNRGVKALQVLLWLVLLGVSLAGGYWVLLHLIKTDPLLLCVSESGRTIHFTHSHSGEKVTERIEARRYMPCTFMRMYSGVPSVSILTILFITILHNILFKVKRLNQLTPENIRNLRSMLKHVETKMVPSAKSWRKILQTDSVTDHD